MYWQTSRRKIALDKTLVMGILNVTPDSFSDGGDFLDLDAALRHADKLIKDGADIIDVGGESSRPSSQRVGRDEEARRITPVIEAIVARHDVPVSADTSRASVAEAALSAGAEIINDISGSRFEPRVADVVSRYSAGLVLMHSRGTFETMHAQEPVSDILAEVSQSFRDAIVAAAAAGIKPEQIALDVGIGFSKTLEQNLELIAKLGRIVGEFPGYPFLIGTSRKSFIGKISDVSKPSERSGGSLASASIAVWNGARIIRAHDVRETKQAVAVAERIAAHRA